MRNAKILSHYEKRKIEKAITLSGMSGNGVLNAEDAKQFVTYLFDETSALLPGVTSMNMFSDKKFIDVFNIAARQTRRKLPGQDPLFRGSLAFTRNELEALKCMFPLEIEEEVFEENIEKESFEQGTLMQNVAVAVANDIMDLGINGDTTSGDDFLSINDGWVKLSYDNGNKIDTTGYSTWVSILKALHLAMPKWFKVDKSKLRFLVSPDNEIRIAAELATRLTALGDTHLQEDIPLRYAGIKIQPVGTFPDSYCLLVNPSNLVLGVEYGIRVETNKQIFTGIHEIAVTHKMDYQLVINDATSLAYSVPTI